MAGPILFRGTSKPYVRWWWLSGPFTREDIVRQLRWVQSQGFGGVELAWMYPVWLEEEEGEGLRPDWLGVDWRELVSFTKSEADALGLGCDFTFGSCWPFGGSWVQPEDASKTFEGLSEQRLERTWEDPVHGPSLIVDHLSSSALGRYAEPLLEALGQALKGSRSALFCDSLELDTDRLWSPELWTEFETRFGYSLRPFANDLDEHVDVRYDYRKLIAETIRREFYEAFTAICREHHAYSRVQCHGAPTDLLQVCAAVDVPESESLLFQPSFSRIAASAAAWAGKPVVSAESFTCIYGFPGWDESAEQYWKKEKIGDLKLLADALFANGINQIVWHGMPYQPAGKEVEFYASVHVGPDSPFAADLVEFNAYLENVSFHLKRGEPYGGVGVYLPFEDALMLDRLPEEQRTPGANFHWEMRHALPPSELDGFHPLWISHAFLKEAIVENDLVCSRRLRLQALYVDCEWLDADSLRELVRLADEGATIIWKRLCRQPGWRREPLYASDLEQMLAKPNVVSNSSQITPLLRGEDLPWYWARVLQDALLVFLAHPKAKEIPYPMPYGFCIECGAMRRELVLRWRNLEVPLELKFEPGQSLLLLVNARGEIEMLPVNRKPGS
ncbi:MAG: hypothetical protein JOZ48_17560 [Acidobacteriaceae bacterium]|nr:hypothetical protein [Acidobacteriaceae bacterium]